MYAFRMMFEKLQSRGVFTKRFDIQHSRIVSHILYDCKIIKDVELIDCLCI